MAKELPYFRFTASEWLNDDISLESYEIKGLFIDICAYYWSQDCECTLAKLEKRFSNATILLKQLIECDIIKHENRHDKIKIDFLVKQYDLLSEKRKVRQSAGSKGGNAKAKGKQKDSYKDNNKDKDRDIEIFRRLIIEKYPKVSKMKIQMTDENIVTLQEKYNTALIIEKLDSMENQPKLLTKYENVYLTLNNWCRKDAEKFLPPKNPNELSQQEKADKAADDIANLFNLDKK